MSDPSPIVDGARERGDRCPACGHTLTESAHGCCPLCDHTIEDQVVTVEDHTPYAESQTHGFKNWWNMCGWVWAAGAGRLAHLSLMRRSPSSRRFRRANLYWIAASVAFFAFTLSGWHEVRDVSGDAGAVAPTGQGWYRLASASPPARLRNPQSGKTVELWWNPTQAVMVSAVALMAALLLGFALPAVHAAGAERSLDRVHKGQQRLGAAWHYCTAWALPLAPAGALLALLPICRIAAVADWSIQPPETWVYVVSGVIAAFAVVFGWLCLVRLANTVPVRSRGRLTVYCGLWMPILATATISGTVWGLMWFRQFIGPAFQLQW